MKDLNDTLFASSGAEKLREDEAGSGLARHVVFSPVASVSRRLLGAVLTIYILVSLAIFIGEFSFTYKKAKTDARLQLQTLHEVFDVSVRYSLWQMDEEQLKFAVDSISKMPNVQRVTLASPRDTLLIDVVNQDQLSWPISLLPPRLMLEKRMLIFDQPQRRVPLGALYIYADERRIFDGLFVSFLITAVSALAKSALLIGLFILFFEKVLSRPLTRVAQHAAVLRPDLGRMERLPIKPGPPDELHVIASAINSLIDEAEKAMAHQAELTEGLVSKVKQLEETQTSLIEAEKMAALGSLVAGVAHEINTPVGLGITGASHLKYMIDRLDSAWKANELQSHDMEAFIEDTRELARSIYTSLERAGQLVRSFNMVAVDQGRVDLRCFAVSSYVQDVVLTHRAMLKRAGVRINIDIDPDLVIFCDPGAWAQILSNLINNALIHGFAHRPAEPQITIGVEASHTEIALHFSDNGAGMTPEVVKQVFDPFFTTNRHQGGSGLGMHIVYNLVTQRMQGAVKVDSTPNGGTHYQFRFVRRALPDSASASVSSYDLMMN